MSDVLKRCKALMRDRLYRHDVQTVLSVMIVMLLSDFRLSRRVHRLQSYLYADRRDSGQKK